MNTIQEFKEKGYVHLKDVVEKELCKRLSFELTELAKNKKTFMDTQCPLSKSIHGTYIFDKLLEDLTPYFERVSGLELYPTCSYARLYDAKGEELKLHRDRPACEISATITLDFDGDIWPIFMADEASIEDGIAKKDEYGHDVYVKNISEVKMEIGDAVMYRGCDIYHWREPYKEGRKQAQVFLHYVDKNGPHAEWKYDKRPSLGITQKPIYNFYDCYMKTEPISGDFCNRIIEGCTKSNVDKLPPIIGDNDGTATINHNIRNVERVMLPLDAGIGAVLTSFGLNTNKTIWNYNITHSHQCEFLIYDVNGKYETHVDTFHQIGDDTRKLTVLAFLNDDFEGGRFYIQNAKERHYPPQSKGTVLVFPSFMPHGVEPVTKGVRYSVVAWMLGPYFK